jgi:hypothetical protein
MNYEFGKDVKENIGHGPFEVLSWHLSGETETSVTIVGALRMM